MHRTYGTSHPEKREKNLTSANDSAHHCIRFAMYRNEHEMKRESVVYVKLHALYFTDKLKDFQGNFDYEPCLPSRLILKS